MDDAGYPGRLWLAAADVPRQTFIDRKLDQWHLFVGMGNWPMTGGLVSDIWPSASIACDFWLAFLVTVSEKSSMILNWECYRAEWLTLSPSKKPEIWQSWKFFFWGSSITGSKNSGFFVDGDYEAKGLRKELSWSLQSFFLREDVIVFLGKDVFCSSLFIHRNHFFLSWTFTCSRVGKQRLPPWRTMPAPNHSPQVPNPASVPGTSPSVVSREPDLETWLLTIPSPPPHFLSFS